MTPVDGASRVLDSAIPRQETELLSPAALQDIVRVAWKQLLGSELHRLTPSGRSSDLATDIAVSASLPLIGHHPLVVVLRTSAAVAAEAAVSVLGLHQDELAPGDIDDAFGGIIGGVGSGLQAVLPEVTRLGAPVVVQGEGLSSAVPFARLTCDASLRSGSDRVHVSLWRPRLQLP